jgi:hypothetical protein
MRTALILGGTFVLLTAAHPAAGQAPAPPRATEAVVLEPEATVYSGPGDKFYPTSKLRRGEKVLVLRQSTKDPSWLEIKPPQGSFSWISSRYIKKSEQNPKIGLVAVAEGETVPVMAGSTIDGREPNVESAKVMRATQVIILEDTPNYAPSAGASLVRIDVCPEEVRYIQAKSVQSGTGIVAASGNTAPQPGAAPSAPAPGTGQAEDLYQQAQALYQKALADPRLDEARRQQVLTYLQSAKQLLTSAGAQGAVGVAQMPGNPNNVASVPGYPTGQLAVRQNPPTGQTTTLYNTNPPAAAAAPATAPAQLKWSSWGTLQKASFQDNGRPMYRLVDDKGAPILYAVPEPGKTLDPYVGSMVAMYGSTVYRSDEFIRMEFMTVSYVAPPRQPATR